MKDGLARQQIEDIKQVLRQIQQETSRGEPSPPPILFQDFCQECQRDTIHKSELEVSRHLVSSTSTNSHLDYSSLPRVLKVCLSCGTITYKGNKT